MLWLRGLHIVQLEHARSSGVHAYHQASTTSLQEHHTRTQVLRPVVAHVLSSRAGMVRSSCMPSV